jgi:hypothetical protein
MIIEPNSHTEHNHTNSEIPQRTYTSTIAQVIQSIGELSNTSNPIIIVIILLFSLVGGLGYLGYKMSQALEGVTQSVSALSVNVKELPNELKSEREYITLLLNEIVNQRHHK